MYSEQSVNPPPPSEGALAAQEQFWRETAPRLDEIEHSLPATGKTSGRIAGKIYSRLHLQPAPVIQAQLLGEWYSLALNDYGVQLQRAGRLDAASEFFIQAGKLNPNNGAVRVNLQCNASLRTNGLMNLSAVDIVNSQLGNFGVLTRFLTLNGMIDEPSFCYVLGSAFLRVSQPRQALQQFERATQLAPAVIAPKLALAELYTRLGFGPKARELINQIRKDSASLKDSADLEDGLSLLEADTWLAQTNKANAREALQTLANSNNENPRTQNLILRAFMAAGDYKNALGFVNRQLAAKPNDVVSLINRATIEVNMGAPQNAVLTLKKAIAITNAFDIRLLLDSARVEAGQLNAAESDYLEIKKAGQFLPAIMNGLSEIARRRGDTNRAVELLKQAITSLPPGSPLIAPMTKRLEELNRR